MSERNELMALRRMAELEAKAGGQQDTQVTSQPQQLMGESPSGFMRGLRDLPDAATQLISRISGQGDQFARFGLKEPINPYIQKAEQDYQAQRLNAGDDGLDWGRLAGNVANPANLTLAAKIPQAVTLGGRMASGAGLGAAFGAEQPVYGDGDFFKTKGEQAAIGGLTGAVFPIATGALSRVVRPKTPIEVQQMMKEGITPTIGQIMGGGFKVAEEKARSIPLLGDAIRFSHEKGRDQLQIAAYKRALSPIGAKPNGDIGHKGIAEVRTKLSAYYDELLPKMTFQADKEFVSDISKVSEMVSALPKDMQNFFQKTLQRELGGRIEKSGRMSGQSLKEAQSKLGEISKSYSGKGGFEGDIGRALEEVRASLMSNLERNSPQYAADLRKANEGWANYVILREAASKSGAKEGVFTPAQLANAVMSSAKKGTGASGKRKVSEGSALMQDLTIPAEKVLSQSYPDSGTAGRVALGGLMGGGASFLGAPAIMGMGASVLPYLPGGRQAMAGLLTQRPQAFTPLAKGIRRISPALTPGAVQLLNERNK